MSNKDTKRQADADQGRNVASQKALADANEAAEKRAKDVQDAQEDDIAVGQQTGATAYVVTAADVHVEPKRAEAIPSTMKGRGSAPIKQETVIGSDSDHAVKVDYAARADQEVPAKNQDERTGFSKAVQDAEAIAMARGVSVVEMSSPDGVDGIYQGRTGGIRVTKGASGVKFSDGLDAKGNKAD